ncbi:MAG: PQQ-binding-like beta-propeller repeat protein, partial [Chloroflexota bacterium]|nr:PQQ-binding-like beta-propeller repeat protein [Chloroflexota bacterium]
AAGRYGPGDLRHRSGLTRARHRAALALRMILILVTAILAPTGVMAADAWTDDTPSTVYAVSTNADGSLIVAGLRDSAVVAYDDGGDELWTFATAGTVYDVAISDDGNRIAVASEDRNVYVLDAAGAEIWRYRASTTFQAVAISGDGQIVAGGSSEGIVSVYDAAGALTWEYAAGDEVSQVAIYGGAGGFRVVSGTGDSRLTLIDGSGQPAWQATLNYSVRGLAVSANGARIVAGDDRETVYLLDGGSGAILWESTLESPVPAVDISQDGNVIVAGGEAGTLTVFDPEGNRTQESATGGAFTDLSLNGDSSFVAVALTDEVAVFPRNDDGAFQVPAPESPYARFILPAVAAVAAVLLAAAAIGFRKRPDGERTWRHIASRNRTLGRDIWRARTSYIFLFPTIVLLLVFNYYPAFSGIYHAFTEWSPGIETTWVGFDQFRELGENRYFWAGIGNLLILIGTGFLKLLIPLAVAEMIFHVRSSRVGYAFRTLFVLQVIVPGVVGVLLWVNVYDPNIGLANQVLQAMGLDGLTRSWLGDADTAIWSIVFMGFPWVSAFALLIFYGGLISIPSELFDSAALDGASTLRRIFNIDLPLLLAQVRLLLILTFIATVQEFAAIFLTTGGGPGSSTYVPSLELYYQAVRFNNFGAASAIGAVLFIVILAGTIINLKYVKSSVEYGT